MSNRLAALVHYIVYRCQPNELGTTKLAKAVVYADLLQYRKNGQTITGADAHQKRELGPVPFGFWKALEALKSEGKVVDRLSPTPAGDRHEFLWMRVPDVGAFSAEEVDSICTAVEYVCRHSAGRISELTHDALWNETPMTAPMPVAAQAVSPGMITPEIMAWAEDDADCETA